MRTLLLPVLAAAGLGLGLVTPFTATAQSGAEYAAAYGDIMMRMHRDMAMEPTGDADLDFAAGMIPHHEGAVAMAELLLEHGNDPELLDMARAIIETQTAEIEFLRAWIARQQNGN